VHLLTSLFPVYILHTDDTAFCSCQSSETMGRTNNCLDIWSQLKQSNVHISEFALYFLDPFVPHYLQFLVARPTVLNIIHFARNKIVVTRESRLLLI
jgi:hypothetical protein